MKDTSYLSYDSFLRQQVLSKSRNLSALYFTWSSDILCNRLLEKFLIFGISILYMTLFWFRSSIHDCSLFRNGSVFVKLQLLFLELLTTSHSRNKPVQCDPSAYHPKYKHSCTDSLIFPGNLPGAQNLNFKSKLFNMGITIPSNKWTGF